jgi:hypothetical protein
MKKYSSFFLLMVISVSLYAQITSSGNFLVVLSKGHNTKKQQYLLSKDYPKEQIEQNQKLGFWVEDLGYGAGLWQAVYSDGAEYTEQEVITANLDFPEEKVKAKREKGFFITDITYGNTGGINMWGVVMARNGKPKDQIILDGIDFPANDIRKKLLEGYRVMEIAIGRGICKVVMEKNTGIVSQEFFISEEVPKEFIEQKIGIDYPSALTHLSYQDNKWYVVASFGSQINSQDYRILNQLPENAIKEGWEGGFIITEFQKFRYKHESTIDTDYRGKIGCSQAIANTDCKRLYEQMMRKGEDHDFEKYEVAMKWMIPNGTSGQVCFSTAQLKELVQLFEYEDVRFDFLKEAYNHTYDLDNFNLLRAALKSKDILKKFDKLAAGKLDN